MAILVRDTASGGWRAPERLGYETEAALQEILFVHPELVPGVSGQGVACREFGSRAGWSDVLVLDSEGSLTLMECKLAANPQVRREIIGQVLDYASTLWRMPVAEFEASWRKADGNDHRSPFDVLGDDDGRIRETLANNLAKGRLNIVLAVDRLNDDLRRIVEFLNEITVPDTGVIVVEFIRATENGVEILIPSSYGAELVEAKSLSTGRANARWSEEEFRAWCADNDSHGLEVIATLLDSMRNAGFQIGGGKALTPSLNCAYELAGHGQRWPISLYTHPSRGALVEVRFPDYRSYPAVEDALCVGIEAIPGIPIPIEIIRESGYRKRPNVSAREFSPAMMPPIVDAIVGAFSLGESA